MSDSTTNGHDADTDADDMGSRPETEESTLGRWAGKAIATIPKPLLGIRGTLFKRMALKSIENYHKTAGGDAIAINAKPGQQIDLEPVGYRSPEEVDEGEKPGWHTANENVWDPAIEGNSVNYLGKTPTILVEHDEHVEAGFLAPRIGQAIEMDRYSPVFTNPTFKSVFDVGGQRRTDDAQALADGGESALPQQQLDQWAQQHLGGIELDRPGMFNGETLIDIDSRDGYDGMRISASKAREWQAENAESEQMQMQEDRGYIRGLAQADDGPSAMKLLLICAGIILGALGIVEVLPVLLSNSGGGGINPLTLSPFL